MFLIKHEVHAHLYTIILLVVYDNISHCFPKYKIISYTVPYTPIISPWFLRTLGKFHDQSRGNTPLTVQTVSPSASLPRRDWVDFEEAVFGYPMYAEKCRRETKTKTDHDTLWLCQNSCGKSSFLMGKSTISMVMFNSYVWLPESDNHRYHHHYHNQYYQHHQQTACFLICAYMMKQFWNTPTFLWFCQIWKKGAKMGLSFTTGEKDRQHVPERKHREICTNQGSIISMFDQANM